MGNKKSVEAGGTSPESPYESPPATTTNNNNNNSNSNNNNNDNDNKSASGSRRGSRAKKKAPKEGSAKQLEKTPSMLRFSKDHLGSSAESMPWLNAQHQQWLEEQRTAVLGGVGAGAANDDDDGAAQTRLLARFSRFGEGAEGGGVGEEAAAVGAEQQNSNTALSKAEGREGAGKEGDEGKAEVVPAAALVPSQEGVAWKPVPFSSALRVAAIACGSQHCVLVTAGGELYSWGSNEHGQLGRTGATEYPERVYFALHMKGLEPSVVSVACGARHTAVVSDRAELIAFGDNGEGQCGYPAGQAQKVHVVRKSGGDALYGADVACGDEHTLVITQEGEVFAFGNNSDGQLGCGHAKKAEGPQLVEGLLGIAVGGLAAGRAHSLCITVAGNVFVWGCNKQGQLGLGGDKGSLAPFWLQYFIGKSACAVRASGNRSFVLNARGTAFVFGEYGDGAAGPLSVMGATSRVPPTPLRDPEEGAYRIVELYADRSGGAVIAVRRQREAAVAGEGPNMAEEQEREKESEQHGNKAENESFGENARFEAFEWSSQLKGEYRRLQSQSEHANQAVAVASNAQEAIVRFTERCKLKLRYGLLRPLCPAFPTLNLKVGLEMVELAKKDAGALQSLANYIEFVLGHPACLNGSFLDEEVLLTHEPNTSSALSLLNVRTFFVEVAKLRSPICHGAMLQGATKCIEYIYAHKLAHSPEILRMFLILLDTPVLLHPDARNFKLLDQLLYCILGLPQLLKTTLLTYIGEYPAEFFIMPVQIFQNFLKYLLVNRVTERPVYNAVVFLSHLNQINEAKRLIPFSQFYNPAVNEMASLEHEYWKWRQRQFSFCQYPFLLTAATKSDILQIDAKVSMKEQMETAILTSVMRGENANPYLVLVVRRQYLIHDALMQVSNKTTAELKKPLKIKFVGEEGIDAGGVKKEFFQLIVRQLLDPVYGMFTYQETTNTFWFNLSAEDMDAEYKLVGTMLGLAIYNGVILDLRFPLVVYKKLAGKQMELADLSDSHPEIANSLHKTLEYDGDDMEDVFCLNFQVSYEYFGATRNVNLIENAGEVLVGQHNKQQFVDLYVKWLLNDSIAKQFAAFAEGFRQVGGPVLTIFRAEELELLACGNKTVDIMELKRATTYKGGFSANHRTVKWFWEIVELWSLKQQKKLLAFATGSDRIPIKGLTALGFVLQCSTHDQSRLPSASTCFNTLLMPDYSSKSVLEQKLLLAVNEASGFGLK